jgi:NitT/TauT family transport system ATP-binding protein
LLVTLWQEQTNAVLLVTHNLREALALADRVLFLSRDPARIVHREELIEDAGHHAQREVDALIKSLLARHPEILSGIATTGET